MNDFYSDAVFATYPNAVTINADLIVFDSVNNILEVDKNVIANKIIELQALEPMRLLREERNQKLMNTDWRMLSDYPRSNQTEWQIYRQALRDITTQTPTLDENGQLTGITWPTPPSD
tara:strand:- start:1823 stop:2176 length:354 start_codon:yes stop_codon:yes gene_type:complete